MIRNIMKDKLSSGSAVLGVIGSGEDPKIAEMLGIIGFDFYMIDAEHGAIDASQAEHIVRACEVTEITPLARVRSNDPKLLLQFLDAGCMGVMMPGLLDLADVEALVQAVKYPPAGSRGLGPVRAAKYMLGPMSQVEYVSYANQHTLVLPQFEDVRALSALPQILQLPGVDGVVIGPRDLAMSMGYYDGPQHPEVQAVIEQVSEMVLRAGLLLGTVAGNGETARALIRRGVRICLNSVPNLLASAGGTFIRESLAAA